MADYYTKSKCIRDFKALCKRAVYAAPEFAYFDLQRNELYSLGYNIFYLNHNEIKECYNAVFGWNFSDGKR